MTIKKCIKFVFCLGLLVAVFFVIVVFFGHIIYYTDKDFVHIKCEKICQSRAQTKNTDVTVFSLIAYSSSEFSLFFYTDKDTDENTDTDKERVVICKAPSRYNILIGAWEVKLYPVFCGDGTCGFAPYYFDKKKYCAAFAEFSSFEILPKSENKNYIWSAGHNTLIIPHDNGIAAGIFTETEGLSSIFVRASPPRVSHEATSNDALNRNKVEK